MAEEEKDRSELSRIIQSRRSIRKFTDRTITEEEERTLIQSALAVPSATNSRPLRITAIQSKQPREELKSDLQRGKELINAHFTQTENRKALQRHRFFWRFTLPMLEAPLLWAVYGEGQPPEPPDAEIEKLIQMENKRQYNIMLSLGASLQNASLKAVELGLGSCIYTAPIPFLRAAKQEKIPAAFIAFGEPVQQPAPPEQNSIESIYQRR